MRVSLITKNRANRGLYAQTQRYPTLSYMGSTLTNPLLLHYHEARRTALLRNNTLPKLRRQTLTAKIEQCSDLLLVYYCCGCWHSVVFPTAASSNPSSFANRGIGCQIWPALPGPSCNEKDGMFKYRQRLVSRWHVPLYRQRLVVCTPSNSNGQRLED